MAPSDDLEQEAINRTQKRTDELAEFYELGELWHKFGIIGDIAVCADFLISHRLLTRAKPFTSDFPRADINELISPDILHQLIKGAFKDHLITWIEELVRAIHPPKEANEILDEIDYR